MIKGIGTDIIEVARVAKAIERKHFLETVFTSQEIIYCQGKGAQAAASYAARYAIKEAIGKALGTGIYPQQFKDINIVKDELGAPSVELSGELEIVAKNKGVQHIHVTASHLRDLASAYVVLEG